MSEHDLVTLIKDEGQHDEYFHILPNMYDDDLDPYEYRLIGHYKRVGVTYEGVRKTALKTQMSVGKVTSTRRSLEAKMLIRVEMLTRKEMKDRGFKIPERNPNDKVKITVTFVCDVMVQNIARYAKGVHGMNAGVHVVNTPVQVVNSSVHVVNERISIEEQQKKKNDLTTLAPDGAVKVVKPSKQSLRDAALEKHDAVIQALLRKFKSDFDLTVLRPKDLYAKTQDQYIEVAEMLCKHGLTADDVPGLLRYLDGKGWPGYGVGKAAEFAPDYAAVKARELIKPAPLETDAAVFVDEPSDNSALLQRVREKVAAEKKANPAPVLGQIAPDFWEKGETA